MLQRNLSIINKKITDFIVENFTGKFDNFPESPAKDRLFLLMYEVMEKNNCKKLMYDIVKNKIKPINSSISLRYGVIIINKENEEEESVDEYNVTFPQINLSTDNVFFNFAGYRKSGIRIFNESSSNITSFPLRIETKHMYNLSYLIDIDVLIYDSMKRRISIIIKLSNNDFERVEKISQISSNGFYSFKKKILLGTVLITDSLTIDFNFEQPEKFVTCMNFSFKLINNSVAKKLRTKHHRVNPLFESMTKNLSQYVGGHNCFKTTFPAEFVGDEFGTSLCPIKYQCMCNDWKSLYNESINSNNYLSQENEQFTEEELYELCKSHILQNFYPKKIDSVKIKKCNCSAFSDFYKSISFNCEDIIIFTNELSRRIKMADLLCSLRKYNRSDPPPARKFLSKRTSSGELVSCKNGL